MCEYSIIKLWRHDDLRVSVCDSKSSGPGLSPGRGHAPLSTQVYKWVQANLMLGVALRWTSIPSRGD